MKEKIPSVVYNALKRKQSEAEEEPAVATPVAESSGSSSNPPVATTVPIVTTKVEESNQTTTPSLELFPEKAKLVDEVSQQHHHLLERIHLYEGKSETIEHTLLTIASCEDLIIKLEHSIDRVKEHKVSEI